VHWDDLIDENGNILSRAHDVVAGKEFKSSPKRHIGLGVNQRLPQFSRSLGVEAWDVWSPDTGHDRELFSSDFFRVINDPNTTIHFDLTLANGEMIDVNKAIREVAKVGGDINRVRVTSWELYKIANNPSALSRTLFYHGPKSISSPFR
jgi:hypothetical protein